jgi:hypothetical protein
LATLNGQQRLCSTNSVYSLACRFRQASSSRLFLNGHCSHVGLCWNSPIFCLSFFSQFTTFLSLFPNSLRVDPRVLCHLSMDG